MDSESLAVAAMLAALSRAASILADLRHPFVRSLPYSYLVPPAGAAAGTIFTLPDGREVRFGVSLAHADHEFHVDAEVTAEDEPLLTIPRLSTRDALEALAVLDSYTSEVADPMPRLLDDLLDALR
ncbi:hypothetical protein OIE66_38010 [Nonomuraea sp. NBC_01738]|uniref:hypothetical protein n=1 Tax=Nonomuraea sp. NBC_01738 TaxID=2976003 RepID=UPI002E12B1E2|nr:hypothetical protein OIE66_38010 [Nonomuraea sp. NBC_01738]